MRVIDVFVDELDLRKLGFEGVYPAATGRPAFEHDLVEIDAADRQEPAVADAKKERLQDKITALRARMKELEIIEVQLNATPDKQTDKQISRSPISMRLP